MSIRGYFQLVTGKTNSDYGDDVKYEFGFPSGYVQLHYRSGTNPIYYSFNGSEDHGVLDNAIGSIQTQMLSDFCTGEIWLRGGSGDEAVEIIAHP